MVKRLKWLSPEQRASIEVIPKKDDEDDDEAPEKSRPDFSKNFQRWTDILGKALAGSRIPLHPPRFGGFRPVWLKP